MKPVKGSLFHNLLSEIGSDTNMSEFESRNALLAYVKYSFELVKLQALLSEKKVIAIDNLSVKMTLNVVFEYLKFLHESSLKIEIENDITEILQSVK